MLLGTDICIGAGEATYPAADRPLPGGIDVGCYPAGEAPVVPMGGPLFWHRAVDLGPGGEGQPTPTWVDASGNGNTLQVALFPLSPLKTLGFLGGKDALVFNRTPTIRQALTWGKQPDGSFAGLPAGNMYTVYIVATTSGPLALKTGPQIDSFSGLPRPVLGCAVNLERALSQTGAVSVVTSVPPLDSHIWHVRRVGSLVEIGMDGVALAFGNFPLAELVRMMGVGCDALGTVPLRSTVVSELLGYGFVVDDANHAGNIAYLKAQFGL